MEFQMQSIAPSTKRGWTVKIDGVEQTVNHLELSSKYGTLTYGQRPEGYDSWTFRETGGGGVVTLPYWQDYYGRIYVGLIQEQRANMGAKPVWGVLGGFVEIQETHAQAQVRETREEAGLHSETDSARSTNPDVLQAHRLTHLGVNSNRAFFVTDTEKGEGVQVYGLPIPRSWIVLDDESDYYFICSEKRQTFPKAEKLCFMHWCHAIRLTTDALALSAIAHLLAYLQES